MPRAESEAGLAASSAEHQVCGAGAATTWRAAPAYRALFETMRQGVFFQRADGTLLDPNPAALRLFGLSRDEFLGRRSEDPRWDAVDESGAALPADRHPSVLALSTGKPVLDTVAGVRDARSGERVWLLIHAIPQFSEDATQPDFVIVTLQDITPRRRAEIALKESERRFRQIVETAEEGIWQVDGEWKTVYVNRRLEEMFGHPPGAMLGKRVTEFILPSEMPAAEQMMAGQEKGLRFSVDAIFLRADGSPLYVHASAVPVMDPQGKFAGGIALLTDVTERRRMELAIKESEQRFRGYFELGLIGMAITGPDKRIVESNDRLCEILGYTRKELTSMSWSDVTHPDDLVQNVMRFEGAMAGRIDAYTMDKRVIRKDGQVIDVTISASCVRKADGTVDHFVAMVQDISERKRAEEALRRSEDKMRSIFRAAPIGIGVVVDRVFAEVNATLCEMVGYAREELMGQTARMLYPSDADYEFVGREKYRQIAQDGHGTVETRFRRRDGRIIDVLLSSTLIDPRDASRGITFTALDITRRKEREAAVRRLTRTERAVGRSSAALLHATDEPSYLREVCRIVVEECGYAMVWIGFAQHDAARSVRPVAWAGFEEGYLSSLQVAWADSDRGRGPTGTAIRSGKPAFSRDTATDPLFGPWRTEALERNYAATAAFPLADGEDRCFGALNIYASNVDAFSEPEVGLLTTLAQDLAFGVRTLRLRADHAEAEAKLEALRGELQRLVEQQVASQTAAGIAHELNQPLNAVTAYGQAARQILSESGGGPAQLLNAVEGMVAHAQQAGTVVRQLLAFLDRGRSAATSLDLESVAREAVSLIRTSGFRGAGIAVKAAPGLRPVLADRMQIEKVFVNLLRNSLEAVRPTEAGGRRTLVAVNLEDNGRGQARVSVTDRGPGVSPDIAPRIFDPFFTTKEGGIGMGLQISRALVEAHGGRLWFEPTEGGGATFHFTVPFAP